MVAEVLEATDSLDCRLREPQSTTSQKQNVNIFTRKNLTILKL